MKQTLITLLLTIATLANSAPTTTYKGGYYYLYIDQQRLETYYTQDYTAKAAAANESFKCNCEVTIEQPRITVNTTSDNNNTIITWTEPTQRQDGTELNSVDIAEYVLHEESEHGDVTYKLIVSDMPAGTFNYNIQAIDQDGLASKPSETVTKNQQ